MSQGNDSDLLTQGDSPPTLLGTNHYSQVETADTSLANIDREAHSKKMKAATIEPDRARFPFCIVWTPLPLISWFLPFIGHTGIAMSDGTIHDFAGPYYISVDDFAFGETHK